MEGGRCNIKTNEVEFKWEIAQFSKVRTCVESQLSRISSVTMKSNVFFSRLTDVKTSSWYLKLGFELNDRYKITLQKSSGTAIFTVQFFILNNEQKKEKLMNDVAKLYFNKNDDYYSYLIAAKYLKEEKYIINDTLTIICNLVQYGEPITSPLPSVNKGLSPETLVKDIKNLLTSGQNSDFTFTINGTEFKVHKTILNARSPVFARIVSCGDFLNRCKNVDNFDKIIKKFLEFIYSDTIEKLDDEDKFSLWLSADSFKVETLKNYCEQYIYDSLNEECILEVLKFAAKYNIDQLLDKSVGYFITHCQKTIKEGEWKSLAKTNQNLYDLILDRLIQNF